MYSRNKYQGIVERNQERLLLLHQEFSSICLRRKKYNSSMDQIVKLYSFHVIEISELRIEELLTIL